MRWAETKVKLKPIRKKQSRPAKWAALYVMNLAVFEGSRDLYG
jgi:hypothetical protein